jgi:hypothetical protein
MFLQDVVVVDVEDIPGYAIVYDVRTNKGGSAIVIRDSKLVKDFGKLPNGPGMVCKHNHVTLVDVHEPSGSTLWTEQERSFNNDLLYLLCHNPMSCVVGGYFNCSLSTVDSTNARRLADRWPP